MLKHVSMFLVTPESLVAIVLAVHDLRVQRETKMLLMNYSVGSVKTIGHPYVEEVESLWRSGYSVGLQP